MKFRFLFLLILLNNGTITAQNGQSPSLKIDSLRNRLNSDSARIYRYRVIKPYANIDFRNAYVTKSFLSLVGLRAGATINSHHIFGLGIYTLNKFPIFKSDRVKKYQFEEVTYGTLFYEYRILDRKYFDVLLPFEIGYGTYTARIVDETVSTVISSKMIPTGFGVKCLVMPHAWIGFKFGAGYRYVWEESFRVGLDGAYFTIGVRIDLDHMSQDIRYNRLKKKYKQLVEKIN